MTAEELILRVMHRYGIDPADEGSNRALAVALNLVPGDASQGAQNVRRWRKGTTDPSFATTMLLLDAAALLNEESVDLREGAAELARADRADAKLRRGLGLAPPGASQNGER